MDFVIGLVVLVLCFPLGDFLARSTKEELASGQKWFRLIVFVSLLGAVVGLVLRNDVFLFSFLAMSIVSSRSLKRKK